MKNTAKTISALALAVATLGCTAVTALASNMAKMTPTVISTKETYYTCEQVEDLFEEEYGYRPNVVCDMRYFEKVDDAVWVYVLEDWCNADCWYVEPTRVNGEWLLSKTEWKNFTSENQEQLAANSAYAAKAKYLNLHDLNEEFEEMLDYDAEVYLLNASIQDGTPCFNVYFDHLGGERYSIDAGVIDGEYVVSEKVFQMFCEENPETTEAELMALEDVVSEFEWMLDYEPTVTTQDDCIELEFEHLGGRTYTIDYITVVEGEVYTYWGAFDKFCEDYPETTAVPDFTLEELLNMLEFYYNR